VNEEGIIQMVADKLQEWKPLARYLQLSDATIREIQYDNEGSYKEQKYQCLKHWIKQSGKEATLINLLKIIYFQFGNK